MIGLKKCQLHNDIYIDHNFELYRKFTFNI